jgi:hypothetical protein
MKIFTFMRIVRLAKMMKAAKNLKPKFTERRTGGMGRKFFNFNFQDLKFRKKNFKKKFVEGQLGQLVSRTKSAINVRNKRNVELNFKIRNRLSILSEMHKDKYLDIKNSNKLFSSFAPDISENKSENSISNVESENNCVKNDDVGFSPPIQTHNPTTNVTANLNISRRGGSDFPSDSENLIENKESLFNDNSQDFSQGYLSDDLYLNFENPLIIDMQNFLDNNNLKLRDLVRGNVSNLNPQEKICLDRNKSQIILGNINKNKGTLNLRKSSHLCITTVEKPIIDPLKKLLNSNKITNIEMMPTDIPNSNIKEQNSNDIVNNLNSNDIQIQLNNSVFNSSGSIDNNFNNNKEFVKLKLSQLKQPNNNLDSEILSGVSSEDKIKIDTSLFNTRDASMEKKIKYKLTPIIIPSKDSLKIEPLQLNNGIKRTYTLPEVFILQQNSKKTEPLVNEYRELKNEDILLSPVSNRGNLSKSHKNSDSISNYTETEEKNTETQGELLKSSKLKFHNENNFNLKAPDMKIQGIDQLNQRQNLESVLSKSMTYKLICLILIILVCFPVFDFNYIDSFINTPSSLATIENFCTKSLDSAFHRALKNLNYVETINKIYYHCIDLTEDGSSIRENFYALTNITLKLDDTFIDFLYDKDKYLETHKVTVNFTLADPYFYFYNFTNYSPYHLLKNITGKNSNYSLPRLVYKHPDYLQVTSYKRNQLNFYRQFYFSSETNNSKIEYVYNDNSNRNLQCILNMAKIFFVGFFLISGAYNFNHLISYFVIRPMDKLMIRLKLILSNTDPLKRHSEQGINEGADIKSAYMKALLLIDDNESIQKQFYSTQVEINELDKFLKIMIELVRVSMGNPG